MSTTRTRHEATQAEAEPRRYAVTVGGTTHHLTRAEAHEVRARLTVAVLGGGELDDRQDLYAAAERQGYLRACTEAHAMCDEARPRLTATGQAAIDMMRTWLCDQIRRRL